MALNLASLSSPNSAAAYTLANAGAVDGSLAYLYASVPLLVASRSTAVPLRRLIEGYRQVREVRPWDVTSSAVDGGGGDVNGRYVPGLGEQEEGRAQIPALLYGRLYLPASHLEALYLRRLSPTSQLKISCVSASHLQAGGSVLFLLSRDCGRYSTDYLYSTDSALFGVRGLYNFGAAPASPPQSTSASASSHPSAATPRLQGRFSAGAELYYGLLNKSGGVSTGLRFTTLPAHPGFPYTMTLTLNPLMGNLSSTYAVQARPGLALCSRFDFNVYSYESEIVVGCELWRRRRRDDRRESGSGQWGAKDDGLEWARERMRRSERRGWVAKGGVLPEDVARTESMAQDAGIGASVPPPLIPAQGPATSALAPSPLSPFDASSDTYSDANTAGVLKARVNQEGAVGVLWEGRAKALLYSFGLQIDFRRSEQIFRSVGLELRYSA